MERRSDAAAPRDGAPDEEDGNGPDDGANQPGAFACGVPAKRLTNEGGEVSTKPDGSLRPGITNLAIRPAIKPMMMVQIKPIVAPP
jgi:hypothetical protein